MKPKHLMIFGVAAVIIFAFGSFTEMLSGLEVPLFACGALFGKGYGIWEERCRP